jgi:hypothetical protein
MRPASYLCLALLMLVTFGTVLIHSLIDKRRAYVSTWQETRKVVQVLGLADLAVSTEARYTRHPAQSDPLAPFMDHPGGLEHFPSGSFLAPVR